ncbi:DUF2642 domain-containing protein [Paenibacillus sp. GYB003]|uniref:DUF2642 domain-containing protein n=1 Tax=Paenibacillus sp. GYB003 TaxID=2994392 RepID=UPI002F967115
MNRPMYYNYASQVYAPIPNRQYYRSEEEPRKEVPVIPKNVMYTTAVEPKFTEHLLAHKGQPICVVTTVGKLEGTLNDVFVDHIALVSHGKMQHIRLCEIVYFEADGAKK